MFYCPLHNWYSDEAPCPACHKTYTTITTITSGEPETQSKEQLIERIEVKSIKWCAGGFPSFIEIQIGSPFISEKKFPAIKQAIEAVLNNDEWVKLPKVAFEKELEKAFNKNK